MSSLVMRMPMPKYRSLLSCGIELNFLELRVKLTEENFNQSNIASFREEKFTFKGPSVFTKKRENQLLV